MKAKSSLGEIRAQRSSPASGRDQSMASSFLPSSLTASSAGSSTLTMSSMPTINFGGKTAAAGIHSSPLAASTQQQPVIAQLGTTKPPTMTPQKFKFSLPEKISASSSPNLSSSQTAAGPTFMFSTPDKVGGSTSGGGHTSSSTAAGSPERMRGVLPDFLTHAGSGRNGTAAGQQQESLRTNNYNKVPVMKMPSTQAMTPRPLLKAGSVMDVLGPRGNRSKLPDVTSTGKSGMFEGGIKPATELKNASVMSILGGMTSATSSGKEPSWDLKFKSNSQPWQ